MSRFTDRFYIIAPLLKEADANLLANAWEPDAGRNKTFGAVRLSLTGLEPATHTICCTLADPAMLTKIMATGEGLIFSKIFAERDGWNREKVFETTGLSKINPAPDGGIKPLRAQVAPDDAAAAAPVRERKTGGVNIPRPKRGRGKRP